jgi:hypothetical protein
MVSEDYQLQTKEEYRDILITKTDRTKKREFQEKQKMSPPKKQIIVKN